MLRGGLGAEHGNSHVHLLEAIQVIVDLQGGGIGRLDAPNRLVGLLDRGGQTPAQQDGFRAILLQRQVQLNRSRAEGLDVGFLRREEAVGGPDQRAEHQREKQGDKAYDRADHITRAGRHMRLGQKLLNQHAKITEHKRQYGDANRNQNVVHA